MPADWRPADAVPSADELAHRCELKLRDSLRGQVAVGDRLLALLPITSTGTYTLYHTSAAPTATGLDAFTVAQPGLQTLMVSAAHPLLLFDVHLSLEWDASSSPGYLQQLSFNLQRASQHLYDFTNGQVALGHVTVQTPEEYQAARDHLAAVAGSVGLDGFAAG